uniref:hypothetical protein n=1 Tax=Altererythrobacter segetis TaxID=1104773 RepID=UPI00140C53E0|nr:hypothetical protein [Altererythrobacter segetis]
MADLSAFNPNNVDDLASRIVQQVSGEAKTWWDKNSGLMTGYVRSLAEAAFQTTTALANGTITAVQANSATRAQKLAFEQTVEFTEFETLVLAQRIVDAVFTVIGWVIYNRTGINLTPGLVQPKAAAGGT